MARGVLRKPVLAPIVSLGPLKYAATQSLFGDIAAGDEKK